MKISAITGIIVGFLITALGFGMPFIDPVVQNLAGFGIRGNMVYVVAFLFVAYGIFRLSRAYKQFRSL